MRTGLENLGDGTFGRDVPIDRIATGLTSEISDKQMYPGNALPGHWQFASYGELWLTFHKLDNPQTTMIVHCVADPGQDLTWGETVVTPQFPVGPGLPGPTTTGPAAGGTSHALLDACP